MTQEEEITRNLTLIEYYKQQLESIDMQLQYLQAAIADYQRAKVTVEQLHAVDDNSDILIPVGGGAFVNGTLKNASSVLLGVGAGLVMEKTVDETIAKLDERIHKVQESYEKVVSLAQKIQGDAEEISSKTQKMMEEAQR